MDIEILDIEIQVLDAINVECKIAGLTEEEVCYGISPV